MQLLQLIQQANVVAALASGPAPLTSPTPIYPPQPTNPTPQWQTLLVDSWQQLIASKLNAVMGIKSSAAEQMETSGLREVGKLESMAHAATGPGIFVDGGSTSIVGVMRVSAAASGVKQEPSPGRQGESFWGLTPG